MVIFNELRIKEDGSCLVIDCEVENVDVYANMYIQKIYLEYYKKTSAASMPGENAFLVYENTLPDKSVRGKRVTLSVNALRFTHFGISSFDDGLFYVIVECGGEPLPEVSYMPCTYDDVRAIGVILDWKSFYTRGMQYVSALYGACGQKNFCDYPAGFEDFIILWNSLKLAINTCNWDLVASIWDRILALPEDVVSSGATHIPVSGGCGCRK